MSLSDSYPSIDSLSPRQVSAFLRRKGWKSQAFPNPDLLVFLSPDDDGASIVLPASEAFADYPAKLRGCLRSLSFIYDIDVLELVHQIAYWDRDVLKIRLESPLQAEQLLPLDYASQMIAKYRDFIAFAAATEAAPRKFYAKLTRSGLEFAKQCMFGHTFIGSFGLTIECPLTLEAELPIPDAPQPRPFQRAVTERIATGYNDMVHAMEADDPEIIVRNHSAGFSGNMCELLNDIYTISAGRSISNRMIWSPELRPPKHLISLDKPFRLNDRSYRILKAASEALHTVDEPEEDKGIVGRITRLQSDKPPVASDEFEIASRTIVVLWEIEKRQPLRMHIELPLEQYRQACDAHKNGRKISIFGKPKKDGRFWRLKEHHSFKII